MFFKKEQGYQLRNKLRNTPQKAAGQALKKHN